ncbi:MAG: zinc-binding dehydrogenase [Chloroflexi bacterium]|nr:zinc-binding dehydrogenase [Chloroflexota bacterium]
MSMIQAVVVDPSAPAHLTLASVEAPSPGRSEALVRVHAFSLNRGEVRSSQSAAAGTRPGWDVAGIVEQAAADASGPAAGARVVGLLRTGAWGEVVAVPTTNLAPLPDDVGFSEAATLPVAGLTALYAIDRADGLMERNVLITGASGGVGHLGVQLAAHGGARVTGLVRQEQHAAAVRDAGAHTVVADETGAAAREGGPFHLVLESVGGQVLGNVLPMMAPGGVIVCFGVSAGGPATFDSGLVLRTRLRMTGLSVFNEINREGASVGLGRLVRLVAADALKPQIALEAPWQEVGSVAQKLLDRAYPGKAVLLVD